MPISIMRAEERPKDKHNKEDKMRRALEKYAWDKAEKERLELVKKEKELDKQLAEKGIKVEFSEDGNESAISF